MEMVTIGEENATEIEQGYEETWVELATLSITTVSVDSDCEYLPDSASALASVSLMGTLESTISVEGSH